MYHKSLIAAALLAPYAYANTILRFSCSQLVTERLDPLLYPGISPSSHVHQITGGNSFNVTMDTDPASTSTCTSCTFTEDFSNYWTATLFFQARNGSLIRVPQKGNEYLEQANGGMTVYYIQPYDNSSVTAFPPGFRMFTGDASLRKPSYGYGTSFTCLSTMADRTNMTMNMPTKPCAQGIMANVFFPVCWDGKNLDSPDHKSHVSYPASGSIQGAYTCPSTHPVKIPQVFYEVVWDTTKFNDLSLWPTNGSQPFVWSYGDRTGYGSHGDYVFGWKGDALQRAMNADCYVNCPTLKTQSIATANKCTIKPHVNENIDGWLSQLPGGMAITG